MPSTSEEPQPSHAVQQPADKALRFAIQQTVPLQERASLIDMRIGLHLLGQEGRLLLAHYIQVKSHQQVLCDQAQTLEKRGMNNGN